MRCCFTSEIFDKLLDLTQPSCVTIIFQSVGFSEINLFTICVLEMDDDTYREIWGMSKRTMKRRAKALLTKENSEGSSATLDVFRHCKQSNEGNHTFPTFFKFISCMIPFQESRLL